MPDGSVIDAGSAAGLGGGQSPAVEQAGQLQLRSRLQQSSGGAGPKGTGGIYERLPPRKSPRLLRLGNLEGNSDRATGHAEKEDDKELLQQLKRNLRAVRFKVRNVVIGQVNCYNPTQSLCRWLSAVTGNEEESNICWG